MEMERFDAFTRRLGGAGSTRRQALRTLACALLGGALGGAAARLGLSEDAEAKATKKRNRRKPGGQLEPTGGLQAEGKRKKKKRRKKPKYQLCDILTCEYDGGRCCPRLGCVIDEPCCPGEKTCGDDSCVGLRQCCPEESPCRDGSCPAPGTCCPEKHQCADGSCVDPFDQCCPDQKRCDNGECVAQNACCPEDALPPWTCHNQCGDQVCEDGEPVCRPRNAGAPCQGPGTACCKGRCHNSACLPARNGRTRHWNQDKCNCDCDVVESCPPDKVWDHESCSCACNCMGSCCLSGCCAFPGGAGCCGGY